MSLPEVKCNVNTCAYWVSGDLCRAGSIRMANSPVGAVPGQPGDTCCATFAGRNGAGRFLATLTNTNWPGLVQETFRPGWQLSPRVTCAVRNCLHWRAGDPAARGRPDAAVDDSAGDCRAGSIQVTGNGASLSEETDCATFLPRD